MNLFWQICLRELILVARTENTIHLYSTGLGFTTLCILKKEKWCTGNILHLRMQVMHVSLNQNQELVFIFSISCQCPNPACLTLAKFKHGSQPERSADCNLYTFCDH